MKFPLKCTCDNYLKPISFEIEAVVLVKSIFPAKLIQMVYDDIPEEYDNDFEDDEGKLSPIKILVTI
jgi:hypothetical protein